MKVYFVLNVRNEYPKHPKYNRCVNISFFLSFFSFYSFLLALHPSFLFLFFRSLIFPLSLSTIHMLLIFFALVVFHFFLPSYDCSVLPFCLFSFHIFTFFMLCVLLQGMFSHYSLLLREINYSLLEYFYLTTCVMSSIAYVMAYTGPTPPLCLQL
jgi:hypothetical protein